MPAKLPPDRAAADRPRPVCSSLERRVDGVSLADELVQAERERGELRFRMLEVVAGEELRLDRPLRLVAINSHKRASCWAAPPEPLIIAEVVRTKRAPRAPQPQMICSALGLGDFV